MTWNLRKGPYHFLLGIGLSALATGGHASAQTLAPYAATLAATQITPASAKLNGLATPNRLSTGCLAPVAQFTGYTPSVDGFVLTFSGSAGAAYRVWASTDLVNWVLLGTASEVSSGIFRYLDAAGLPQRFYRAGTP